MQEPVYATVRYFQACQECDAQAEWWCVQQLVGDSLRGDVESVCSTCGCGMALCGGDLTAELRERLLDGHGRARLQVTPPVKGAMIMRVLRAELGLDLANVKTVLQQVLAGEYSGTLPEVELIARKLRAAGIDAVASFPQARSR
ncbi:hypothetical protein [Streptomyces sp. NRRL S-337]|uniref:hypothetical protein n=1 Tax=Streptomyces sp. NRRL S-337 TaxID=1463900 RepID=UPI0004C6EE9F|nr:hypothetical protein [Streptomyces sp. NRRL S-337]